MNGRTQLVTVLAAELVAAAGVLLVAGRPWQTITAVRPRPLANELLDVSGTTLEPAVTALGLVALAGVVAVLATRGVARRIIGVVLALAGAGLGWRALTGLSAVSHDRALSLLRDKHIGVGLDSSVSLHADVHAAWPVLTLVCALVVLAAGVLVAWRGATWSVLSSRYEAPVSQAEGDAAERARADAALWRALDRGDDPTSHTEP